MKKTTRSQASRPSRESASASRTTSARKAPAPGRAATRSTAASGKAATKTSRRRCEAPNCNETFEPRSDRQMYCSPACKVRAFYWAYKNEAGERYAARYERSRKRAAAKKSGSAGRSRTAARRRTTR